VRSARYPETAARDPLASRVDDLARIDSITLGGVRANHAPFTAQVNLRLDPSLSGLVPFPLPRSPNTMLEADGRATLWLGPDEWLVVGAPLGGEDLVDELEHLLGDQHRSVVDVSANRVAIALSGPGRLDLLARGCSLDLHPSAWNTGMCAQTMLGKTQVILFEGTDATTILVRTSFADYLLEWLLAAVTQLGPVATDGMA
jgi:sarcosine oxidase subunit gamma